MSDVPLHQKVFQIKAAIRKAGFVAHGRTRLDKSGRVIMGVIVPVAFSANALSSDDVLAALRYRVGELCDKTSFPDNETVVAELRRAKPGEVGLEIIGGRPADLRSREGRAWKAAQQQVTM